MITVTEKDIDNILSVRRETARRDAQQRRDSVLSADANLRSIDGELTKLRVEKFRAIRAGQSTLEIDCRIESAAAQFDNALKASNMTRDFLEPRYVCEKCHDTGYIGTKRCCCADSLVYEMMYEQACLDGAGEQCFENFRLDIFDGEDEIGKRQRLMMEKLYAYCRKYSDGFVPRKSESLVFSGQTGTGKTFLSNCIASSVLKKGFSVLAVSSYSLMEVLKSASFNGSGEIKRFSAADLLVIDELGMEQMMSNITIEMLFMVINERYRRHLPSIINTNLTPAQMTQRYTERITSRLFDKSRSKVFRFEGNDIRLKNH